VKVHKPDFSIIAVECPSQASEVDAIDLSAIQLESAIDAQLLLIHDRVNNGHLTFPDNFDLLYDKNVWIFDTGTSCNSSRCMVGAVNSFQAIVPLTGQEKGVLFTGVYLPQKSVLLPPIASY
jgi:hypothetical protein